MVIRVTIVKKSTHNILVLKIVKNNTFPIIAYKIMKVNILSQVG